MLTGSEQNALNAFAALAEQFCSWTESTPKTPEDELLLARALVSKLYAAAFDLPEGTPLDEDAHGGGLNYVAAHRRFDALPINMYATCDPLEMTSHELLIGDVADDLADTYADLRRGLVLHREGHLDAAAWEWSHSFRHHWGDHVAGALWALQAITTKS